METKVNANLNGVPETMLLTLYARAKYSKKESDFFYDRKSVEIAERLNYDFSAADSDVALNYLTLSRTVLIDKMVKDFIVSNPEATIINIACGLDTRFFRVDNGKINWFDIDLAESINVRKNFFDNSLRHRMIAASAMDEAWARAIGVPHGNVLVIIEGLSMYLNDISIRKIFGIINRNFANAEVFMEIMPKKHVTKNRYKSVATANANFSWGVDSGEQLDLAGFDWLGDFSVNTVLSKMGFAYKLKCLLPYAYKNSEKIAVFKSNIIQNYEIVSSCASGV